MPKQIFIIVFVAGLINGCAGGQTKPDDANSQQQHRCGPQTRCGSVDDENPPPKSSQKIVVPEQSDPTPD